MNPNVVFFRFIIIYNTAYIASDYL